MNRPVQIDVTEADFDTQVLAASRERPVLVDFWATWCGPCQSLMPVLQKLAEDYQGAFLLAKVEIDQNPGLAARYGVRSVPTVKLLRNGEVVDEFMGALPESAIREFLDRHVEKESDRQMQAARDLFDQGNVDAALEKMRAILEADPANARNFLRYAEALVEAGRLDQAREQLDALPLDWQDRPEAKSLRARLELEKTLADAPPREELEKRLEADPGDKDALYLSAMRALEAGDHDTAIDRLLQLLMRDRNYGDDIAHRTLLQIFDMLGDEDERVQQGRRRLAMALH